MRSIQKKHVSLTALYYFRVLSLGLLLVLSIVACSFIYSIPLIENSTLLETQTAISMQQTQVAGGIKQATATAELSLATLTAQSLLGTQLAHDATTTVSEGPGGTPTSEQASEKTPSSPGSSDWVSKMKSANILLYEDMAYVRDANRYVKPTLDRLGIPYIDVAGAQGDLKTYLLAGGYEGKEWDLVIIASEAKSGKPGISGEYFEYINTILDHGTSVILETSDLDVSANGIASTLLSNCGVEFESDWYDVRPEHMAMYPLDPSHPILNEPNSDLTFTKVTNFWWDPTRTDKYDIGDRLRLVPGSQAKLLVGTQGTDPTLHGTVVVCVDGRFILQTFSSHQLSFNAMQPLWENYIYNALKARLESSE